jgi:hypothetical protein
MRKSLLSLFFCFLLIGLYIISNGQTAIFKSNPGIEKEIDAAFLKSIKAAETLDVPKLINDVDDSRHAGFIANANFYSTFDELANILKSREPGSVKQTITLQKKKITVLAENIALVTASGVSQVEFNGGNPFSLNFFWTFVYEKINNEWKVIQSHQSGK